MVDRSESHAMTPWRARSSRLVHQNPWLSLREDIVEMPDGDTTTYGVVTLGDCVGVLPFVDDDTVLLIRQYRYVAGMVRWEMPTGGVHPGEDFEDAAQRELSEETGHRSGRLSYISSLHTSKSVVDETAHLYVARDLSKVEGLTGGDSTEFIEVRPTPWQRVVAMVRSGEITDAMTIVAVLQLASRPD
ncbi:MAG: NUDIX hydrolase [Actinomycetota bacterium]|nr:NUDIX hydrolase [Actinomycetota bacterium]